MDKERGKEKGPRPTEFRVVDSNGTTLTVHFGYDIDVFLEGDNRDGERTSMIADFPSVINGGGRHPETIRALDLFGSSAPTTPQERLPLQVTTQDDSSRNYLTVSVSPEHDILVTITGRPSSISFIRDSKQAVTFILSPEDAGFSPGLLDNFTNLASAMERDEAYNK